MIMLVLSRVSIALATVALLSTTACLDRQLGSVGQVADTSNPSDTAGGDVIAVSDATPDSAPDAGGPDLGPDCVLLGMSAKVGIADFVGGEFSFLPPIVDEARVYGNRAGTEFSNAPADTEVVAVSVDDGTASQLTANDFNDLVVDARDGAVLLERAQADGARVLVHVRNDAETVLADDVGTSPAYHAWVDGFEGAGRRHVWGAHAAWRNADRTGMRFFDGSTVETVYTAQGWLGAPDGHGEGFVFAAAADIGTKIMVYRLPAAAAPASLTEIVQDGAGNRFPVMGSKRVFWNADGAIVSALLDGSDTRILAEGPCGAPVASGERAAFVCASDPSTPFSGAGPFWLGGDSLYVFDGLDVKPVPTQNPHILAPAIHGDTVGWAGYPEGLVGMGSEVGHIYIASFSSNDEWIVKETAAVGFGCYVCQIPSAPTILKLDENSAAWNFPVLDVGAAPSVVKGAIGYARITPKMECL